MANTVNWCPMCKVPVVKNKKCPICGADCKAVSVNGVCNPVFKQERKLLSMILKEDVVDDEVWYLGNSNYLVGGKRIHLPYIEFYRQKAHIPIAKELRENVECEDEIARKEVVLAANEQYLRELLYEAEEYVSSIVGELKSQEKQGGARFVPTVSFSGGKDSTAVSRIVRDALQDETIVHFFGDTTLEFPSTYRYIENEFRKENPFTPMHPSETENDFFKLCNVFGPPSKFERWCCTIFKTGSLNTEYQNLTGNSLTFLGIRHSESRERKNYERTQTHSKIGSQVNAMPIIEWSDCDVWLYILFKGLKFNDAYRLGYKRVGCWCCPNNSDWSMMLTDIYFPDLAAKWKGVLTDFAQKTQKQDIEDYVENGKWKTRKGASGLQTKNVTIADTACNLSDRARNVIIKKKIQRDVLEFLKPFGELEVFDKDDAAYITVTEKAVLNTNGDVVRPRKKTADFVITWGTPVLKVLPEKGTDVVLMVNRLKCQLRKYQYCIRCSACDSICPYGAINTIGKSRYMIDETKCRQNLAECSRCIAKFYNGCITCQVLAGKKNVEDDNIDS